MIGIPPMLSHIQWPRFEPGAFQDWSGRWVLPLWYCPNIDCDNDDPQMFDLYSTDADTCRWYGSRRHDDGTIGFAYGKSVYTEGHDSITDTINCRVCDHEFDAAGYAYDLE